MPDKPSPPKAEPTWRCPLSGTQHALAVDPRSGLVYTGGSGGTLWRTDLNASAPVAHPVAQEPSYLSALALLADAPFDQTLLEARYDGSLTWRSLPEGRVVRKLPRAHAGWIRDLVLFPDQQRCATVGDDLVIRLWDVRSGDLLHEFTGHAAETPAGYKTAIYTLAVSADGAFLASGDRIGEVLVWNVAERRLEQRFQADDFYTFDPVKRDRSIGGIRRVRFSPDGQRLAVSGIGAVTNVDGFVGPCRAEIWDWKKPERQLVLQDDHQAVLNDLLWTPNGSQLFAAGGGDGGGLLIHWDATAGKLLRKVKFTGHTQRLARLDATRFVATGFEEAALWDPVTWPAEEAKK